MSPKVYVVSESIDNARLDRLYSQFPEHEGCFTVTPAVMGGKLTAAEYYNYVCENYNLTQRILTPAEVGCALSHLAIYQSVIDNQAAAIILEDDVLGSDEKLSKTVELAINIKPHQIIILGGMNGLAEEKLLKFISDEDNSLAKLEPSIKKLNPLSYPYLGRTCCYIIGHQAAAIIAEQQQRCLLIADAWGHFSEGSSLEFYYTNLLDHPIIDEHLNSHIEQERRRLVYIPSYKLAVRNMFRLIAKKINLFKLSRV